MLDYEKQLWGNGLQYIAGVDEAGRGCLFGDVVAAAVIFPEGLVINGINDSKKLSEKRRNELFEHIHHEAISIGIGRVDATVIDRINIKQASRLAMKYAVEQLAVQPEHVLIDAEQIDSALAQTSIVKGDQLSQSIAAASIVAKVTRDRLCEQWERDFPGYEIAKHKGYATKVHRERLLEMGPSAQHRLSFLNNLINR